MAGTGRCPERVGCRQLRQSRPRSHAGHCRRKVAPGWHGHDPFDRKRARYHAYCQSRTDQRPAGDIGCCNGFHLAVAFSRPHDCSTDQKTGPCGLARPDGTVGRDRDTEDARPARRDRSTQPSAIGHERRIARPDQRHRSVRRRRQPRDQEPPCLASFRAGGA